MTANIKPFLSSAPIHPIQLTYLQYNMYKKLRK